MNSVCALPPVALTFAPTAAPVSVFESRYKQGEVTLRLCISPKAKTSDNVDNAVAHLSQARTESELLLAQLLVESGIISLSDINTAIKVARINERTLMEIVRIFFLITPQMSQSLKQLVSCIQAGTRTFVQSVSAARQAYLTDGMLTEMTGSVTRKYSQHSNSLVYFLKEMGLISEQVVARLAFGQPVDATVVTNWLVATGAIDVRTLRLATRLRYLLNNGEVDFERAKSTLDCCLRDNIEVEDYFAQCAS